MRRFAAPSLDVLGQHLQAAHEILAAFGQRRAQEQVFVATKLEGDSVGVSTATLRRHYGDVLRVAAIKANA
jgi:hypothetical protein